MEKKPGAKIARDGVTRKAVCVADGTARERAPQRSAGVRFLRNLSGDEITALMLKHGQPRYRAEQICGWLFQKYASSFDDMSNIPAELRSAIEEEYSVSSLNLDKDILSTDGSRKLVFGLHDGLRIESVMMPELKRHTLCVSTQVGCGMGCRFCLTGKGGLRRNLDAAEIIDQIMIAQKLSQKASNIVFMGMGEPLANLDNLARAIEALTAKWGSAMSPRRLTVSTVGKVDLIESASRKLPAVGLAVSLNAPNDSIRTSIMPAARKHGIREIVAAASNFAKARGSELTFEYVLLSGLNDAVSHARELAALLRGVRCMVNLIPFNPFPGAEFKRPQEKRIEDFQNELKKRGLDVFVRSSRGRDIGAACGQLTSL